MFYFLWIFYGMVKMEMDGDGMDENVMELEHFLYFLDGLVR